MGPKYYTYFGCNLHSFIKKIFNDLIEKRENFLKDYKKDYLLEFYGSIKRLKIKKFNDNADIIFVYLSLGDIVIVKGEYNNNKFTFEEKCKCYQNFSYKEIEVELNEYKTGFAFFRLKI